MTALTTNNLRIASMASTVERMRLQHEEAQHKLEEETANLKVRGDNPHFVKAQELFKDGWKIGGLIMLWGVEPAIRLVIPKVEGEKIYFTPCRQWDLGLDHMYDIREESIIRVDEDHLPEHMGYKEPPMLRDLLGIPEEGWSTVVKYLQDLTEEEDPNFC